MAKVFIGTSGYSYRHWENGVFYPQDLPKNKQLQYYSQFFKTVELNVTFYRLPEQKVFSSWDKRTPSDFSFAVKGSRFITHIKKLEDSKEPLRIFFERILSLKEKVAVVLWQLPPSFRINLERLKNFIKNLKIWETYRQAFEFRHPSWFCDEVYRFLKAYNITICHIDWPGLKEQPKTTFPFIYIRRHGPVGKRLYMGCYLLEELEQDAIFIKKQIKEGKDVFIYFNNDAFGYAIKNALELKKILGE
jgi:uncharacterized protein YecE (DUF72 family)